MSRPAWKSAAAFGVFGLAIAFALARVTLHAAPGGVRLGAAWVMIDFYDGAYFPVKAFLAQWTHDTAGAGPGPGTGVPGWPYLPINLLLHLPFTLLQPRAAGAVYFCLTALLTLSLAVVVLRLARYPVEPWRVALVAGLVLLSRPGHWTLLLGQRSILLTLLVYIALRRACDAPLLSGIALAAAIHKPTFGLPVAALMLASGYGRAAAGIGLLLSAAVNIPLFGILAERAGGVQPLVARLLTGYDSWQGLSFINAATSHNRIDAVALVSRFLGYSLSSTSQLLLALALLGTASVAIHRLPASAPAWEDVKIGIICLTTLLVGYHMGYDLVLLTAPLLVFVAHGLAGVGPGLRRVCLTLYLLPAFNWVTTDAVVEAWHPTHSVWLVIASVNGLCIMGLFVAYVLVALRSQGLASREQFLSAERVPV